MAKTRAMYYFSNNLVYYRHQLLKLFGNKVLTEAFGRAMQTNAEWALKIYCSDKQGFGEYCVMDPKLFGEDKPAEAGAK